MGLRAGSAVGGSSSKRGQEGAQDDDAKARVAKKSAPASKKARCAESRRRQRPKNRHAKKPAVAATGLTGIEAAVYFYIDASGIVTHPGKDDDLFGNDLDAAPLETIPLAVSQGRLPASVCLRGLVLVLLLLLWGSIPLFDLPSVTSSGCVLTASVSAHQTRSRVDYSLEERDYLIRTVAFEAAHEPERGRAAVAHVVLNRKQSARWANSIKAVVTQPWQFEPWMTRRQEVTSLSADDPRYQNAAKVVDAVLAGQISDPTAGATHFLNEMLVRERNGGSLPSWAKGDGLSIGSHTFYAPTAIRNSSSDTSPFSTIVSAIFFARPQKSC
jgi:spore germination cell wall hydrolase CwlJ-like protein